MDKAIARVVVNFSILHLTIFLALSELVIRRIHLDRLAENFV